MAAKFWRVWSVDGGETRENAVEVVAFTAEEAVRSQAQYDHAHVVDDWADGSPGTYCVVPDGAPDTVEPERFACTPHVQPITWTVRPA